MTPRAFVIPRYFRSRDKSALRVAIQGIINAIRERRVSPARFSSFSEINIPVTFYDNEKYDTSDIYLVSILA